MPVITLSRSASSVAVGVVAFPVNAIPSHAAACNGYVGLNFDDGPSNRC
jgi:endo-1,4-beta-xylanase